LVAWCLTNAYQSSDLGAGLPSETFTNLYHRDGGLGIDLSVGGDVRWCGSRVRGGQGYIQLEWWRTVENTRCGSERWHTGLVGIAKKKSFSSGRSASKFIPMVVKLVGQ